MVPLEVAEALGVVELQEDGRCEMIPFRRVLQNITTGWWHVSRTFNGSVQAELTKAVRIAEQNTSAEIRVVVEGSLRCIDVIKGMSVRERALDVFGEERVWDTEENNGILLYLLVSERDAEIVVDRGFNEAVSSEQWEEVCLQLERDSKQQGLAKGISQAIRQIGTIASGIYPSVGGVNELSDEIVVR